MFGAVKGTEKHAMMRKQQIDSLKLYNDRVTEIVEGSEYRVDFLCNNRLFKVVVSLSPEFPLDKPTVRVEPIVNHSWVSPSGEIVSAPGLLKFSVHSELGRVVQAIVREFELRPPPVVDEDQSCDPVYRPPQPASSSNGLSSIGSLLNTLPMSELERLYKDEDHFEEFVSSLPAAQEMEASMSETINRIEALALDNLSKETQLQELNSRIEGLVSELSKAKEDYHDLNYQYLKMCEKYSPEAIRECVLTSITQIDEDSEKIAETFLSDGGSLDAFLTDYIGHRMLSHSRKFKTENLGQQLRKLHQAGF